MVDIQPNISLKTFPSFLKKKMGEGKVEDTTFPSHIVAKI